ncbi:UNVERIFIED_CONTAM: hypothetical protein K2H54_023477 [Gekko kuhli]
MGFIPLTLYGVDLDDYWNGHNCMYFRFTFGTPAHHDEKAWQVSFSEMLMFKDCPLHSKHDPHTHSLSNQAASQLTRSQLPWWIHQQVSQRQQWDGATKRDNLWVPYHT